MFSGIFGKKHIYNTQADLQNLTPRQIVDLNPSEVSSAIEGNTGGNPLTGDKRRALLILLARKNEEKKLKKAGVSEAQILKMRPPNPFSEETMREEDSVIARANAERIDYNDLEERLKRLGGKRKRKTKAKGKKRRGKSKKNVKGGGWFSSKPAYQLAPNQCDDFKRIDNFNDSRDAQINYQTCCPKTFGSYNSSPYCKVLRDKYLALANKENEYIRDTDYTYRTAIDPRRKPLNNYVNNKINSVKNYIRDKWWGGKNKQTRKKKIRNH